MISSSLIRRSLLAVAVAATLPASAADYNFTNRSQGSFYLGGQSSWNETFGPQGDSAHTGNNVTISFNIEPNYGFGGSVYGGYQLEGGAAVTNNTVTMTGSTRSQFSVLGGYGVGADAGNNKVSLVGSAETAALIFGAESLGGSVYGNTVLMDTTGAYTAFSAFGARAMPNGGSPNNGSAHDNKLIVRKLGSLESSGSTGPRWFCGAMSESFGDVYRNSVEFSITPDLDDDIIIEGTFFMSETAPVSPLAMNFYENSAHLTKGAKATDVTGASISLNEGISANIRDNTAIIEGTVKNATAVELNLYSCTSDRDTGKTSGNRVIVGDGGKVTGILSAVYVDVMEGASVRHTITNDNQIVLRKGADVSEADVRVVFVKVMPDYSAQTYALRSAVATASVSAEPLVSGGGTLVLDGWQGSVRSIGGFDSMDVTITDDVDPTKPIITVTESADLPDNGLSALTLTVTDGAVAAYANADRALQLLDASVAEVTGELITDSTVQTIRNVSGLVDADMSFNADGTVNISEFRPTPKAHGYFEGVTAMLGISSQATELMGSSFIENEMHKLQAGSVSAIAALEGSSFRWQTGSSIDVKGVSGLVGAGTRIGNVSAAGFFEFGYADFDTVSQFNSSGDGAYYGLGALARYDAASGLYAEGSVHLGWLDAKFDGETGADGYDQTGLYTGLHVGAGYRFPLCSVASLDVFAKYFLTHQSFDDVKVNGSEMKVDDAMSSRTRLGARATYQDSQLTGWLSLAWDHEFDGKAEGSVAGIALTDAPELKGDSAVGEVGVKWNASEQSPWSFSARLGGYCGDRDGVFGSVGASYRF